MLDKQDFQKKGSMDWSRF